MQNSIVTNVEIHALIRQDFLSFVHKVFETLNPGQAFLNNWHIVAIAHHIEKVDRGEINRLMINIPPRSLKSMIVSIAWPAFILGHNPGRRIVVVSHNMDLAISLSNEFRKVVEAPWYKSAFPTMKNAPEKNTEREFVTTKGGSRMAKSVGGSITGMGGDTIILDDPLDASDADSQIACDAISSWVDTVLSTRLNNPAKDPMVLVMQRLSIFDLSAHLAETEKWVQLRLPAIAEADTIVEIGKNETHEYKQGQLLHPERLDEVFLNKQRTQMGEAAFLAQYQQRPIPGGGGLINIGFFRRYDILPKEHDGTILSVDAASGSDSGSYTVIQTYQVTDGKLYLIDSKRGRWKFPDLRELIISLHNKNAYTFIVIEKASSGLALLEELFEYFHYLEFRKIVYPQSPKQPKEIRMERAMVSVKAGNVYLPRSADWLQSFFDELQAFPEGINDDQVDALSQAINFYRKYIKSHVYPGNDAGGFRIVEQGTRSRLVDRYR